MFPIIKNCNKPYKVLFTNQHFSKNMGVDFIKELGIDKNTVQSATDNILEFLQEEIDYNDTVIVQGDTRSAYYGALIGSMKLCKIFHIEAGLRTYDFNSPYPEEFYRCEISRLATKHFAPTHVASGNLLKEGINSEDIIINGNTVMQALENTFIPTNEKTDTVVVTIHRNENKKYMADIAGLLIKVAENNSKFSFKVLLHPNNYLSKVLVDYKIPKNLDLLEPLGYKEFLNLLNKSKFAITDSGGLQEECCYFNTYCITLRDTTERPETLLQNYGNLFKPEELKNNIIKISNIIKDYDKISRAFKENPYYDKNCINKIIEEL